MKRIEIRKGSKERRGRKKFTAKEVRTHVQKTQILELREARVHLQVHLMEEKMQPEEAFPRNMCKWIADEMKMSLRPPNFTASCLLGAVLAG